MSGASLKAHLISVDPGEAEQLRTGKLVELLRPLSSKICASLEELESALPAVNAGGDDAPVLVRLFGRSHTQSLVWLGSKGRASSDAAILGYADAIIAESGQPPRAVGVLAQAFVSAVASKKITYDASGAAILIGACDETRAIGASLSRLGFKRMLVVDPDDEKSEQMVQILRRRLFGIEIEAVPRVLLTQVPNGSSIAVNLMNATETSLLEDVSYLNFLKKNGLWIDWTKAMAALGYDDDVADAGAQVFSSDLIRAWRDTHLLQALPGIREFSDGILEKRPEQFVSQLYESWSGLAPGDPTGSEILKTDPS